MKKTSSDMNSDDVKPLFATPGQAGAATMHPEVEVNMQAYIEPVIRTIAGGFIVACGILLYMKPEWSMLWLSILLFVGFNLFQSGFTKFCMMEKLLKKLHFRSELDEINSLSQANAEAEARAAFYDTLGLLNEVVIELSRDGKLAFLSDHWLKLLGSNHPGNAHFLGHPFTSFINTHDRDPLERLLQALLNGDRDTVNMRFRMLREDHLEHWVEGKFALYQKQGRVQGIRGVLRDVTEAHVQEKRINHMAMHDALTNLPNRTYLDIRITRKSSVRILPDRSLPCCLSTSTISSRSMTCVDTNRVTSY